MGTKEGYEVSTIVCGVTGSEVSERAVREAAFVAKQRGAKLVITYAVDASFLQGITVELRPEFAETSIEYLGKKILERMANIAREEGVEPVCTMKKGRMLEVLKEVAMENGAYLLVLGKEEPSFFDKVLFRDEVEDHVRELRERTGLEVMLVR